MRKPDATMLAVSFDEVGRRIVRRGHHNPSFAKTATAEEIAYSFRRAIYDESKDGELFFGMPVRQFADTVYSNHIEWIGDEEFDDGSYVLQFEDENRVRLVASQELRIFFMTRLACATLVSQRHVLWNSAGVA